MASLNGVKDALERFRHAAPRGLVSAGQWHADVPRRVNKNRHVGHILTALHSTSHGRTLEMQNMTRAR